MYKLFKDIINVLTINAVIIFGLVSILFCLYNPNHYLLILVPFLFIITIKLLIWVIDKTF